MLQTGKLGLICMCSKYLGKLRVSEVQNTCCECLLVMSRKEAGSQCPIRPELYLPSAKLRLPLAVSLISRAPHLLWSQAKSRLRPRFRCLESSSMYVMFFFPPTSHLPKTPITLPTMTATSLSHIFSTFSTFTFPTTALAGSWLPLTTHSLIASRTLFLFVLNVLALTPPLFTSSMTLVLSPPASVRQK